MKVNAIWGHFPFCLHISRSRACLQLPYAKLPAEIFLCEDETLGTRDRDMSRLYFSMYNAAPRGSPVLGYAPTATRRKGSESFHLVFRLRINSG